ncbi:MAG: zinc metallopeptidase [Clostridia bacterium]|nr:zinc metallopeptidase [Clostridia bacterium]
MPVYYGIDIWYLILILPALVLSVYAQFKVKSTYAKYAKVMSRRGMTANDAVSFILRNNGITDVSVQPVAGELTDHYSPKEKIIRLSEGVFGKTSVAALGIAAHEAGHTVQHYSNYGPINFRNALVPVANLGSVLAMPLILIGFVFNFSTLINLGIIFFATATLFQLVTLPVELNASSRAMKALESSGALNDEELKMTKKVLTAAALTYVAALAVSFAQLLRLILISSGRSNRRR